MTTWKRSHSLTGATGRDFAGTGTAVATAASKAGIDMGGPMEIVGVVGNTRLRGPIAADVAEVYRSTGYFSSPALLVRVAGSPESIVGAVREKLKRIEPEIRIGVARPLERCGVGTDRAAALHETAAPSEVARRFHNEVFATQVEVRLGKPASGLS